MAYNRRRPDGGEAQSVDTVDMVPMCKTVSCDEACALEFQNASGIFHPDSAVVRLAVNIKDNIYDMEDGGHPAWDICCTGLAIDTHGYVGYVDGDIYMARLCYAM